MMRHLSIIVAILTLFVGCIKSSNAAMVPPGYISSVVAIGALQPVVDPGQPVQMGWVTFGTGFFYGKLVRDDPEPTRREYKIFLVTAKHVVQEYLLARKGDLQARVNPKETASKGQEFSIPSNPSPGTATWFFHPDEKIDVAIVPINFNELRNKGFDVTFFSSDLNTATSKKMLELGTSAGDGIFVLGFPMNLAGKERSYVIVRQGVIARLSELAEHASSTFMIDAFVFPGNSGGPVILKPEITSIQGTKNNGSALLIGMILSYQPYNDVAVSAQTKQPRVIFQENSGLAEVLPMDKIEETIEAWQKTFPDQDPK
jgi:hypothetical protein